MNKVYMAFIYLMTNMVNNKVYVGQTTEVSPIIRWRKHKSSALHNRDQGNNYFFSGIRKHGPNNFSMQVLKQCSDEELDYWEDFYFDQYQSTNREFGYNTRKAGSRGRHTEETKEKLRQANLGKKLTEEHKAKLSAAKKGIPRTEEWKEKMSEIMSGRPLSEDHCRRISEGKKGVKFSDEHKKNISKSKSGENGSRAKLTWEIVRKIREEYKTGIIPCDKLANKYGMCHSNILAIIDNETWIDENYDISHVAAIKAKHRNRSGEKNNRAKLNWDQVREIRAAKSAGVTDEELAIKYGVSRATITVLVNNKTWIEKKD